jgi:hypothetical protein
MNTASITSHNQIEEVLEALELAEPFGASGDRNERAFSGLSAATVVVSGCA